MSLEKKGGFKEKRAFTLFQLSPPGWKEKDAMERGKRSVLHTPS